eukprot:GFUD01043883.1.p1 GENE.GFUD01043883.1~~GFUD01043883.1.p1  ORF type:complete len:1410 (-),score=481.54 GFUD01043883.1:150-4379(-)
MDPGVAKLLERTKARRGELKELSTESSPLPSERDRSPLKQRNREEDGVFRSNKKVDFEDSPSKQTVKRLLKRESLENNVADLMSRESPGKTLVTRTVSTKVSPSKTTITKTVITEKEEKYEKKEIISYSGNKEFLATLGDKFDKLEELQPNKKHVDSSTFSRTTHSSSQPADEPSDLLSGRKARLANLASKFKNIEDEEPLPPRHIQLPKPVSKPAPRAPSPSKHAPVKTDHIRSASPVKSSPRINPQQFINPQVSTSPTKQVSTSPTKQVSTCPTKPSNSYRSLSPVKSFRSVSPTKASPINRPASPVKAPAPPPPPTLPKSGFSPSKPTNSSRSVSPSKAPDASFLSSLKAQGFQESESKTRLVYDFEKENEESTRHQREQSLSPSRSPVKSNMFVQQDMENQDHERNVSPVRGNPFLVKDKRTRTSPTRDGERGRSSVKKPVEHRAISPEKPHPLQFVTPQTEQAPPPPPPKPSRTYETKPARQADQSGPTQNSLKPSQVKPKIQVAQEDSNNRMDSPAMKTVSQKRDMFEQGQVTPEAEKPDPALMSMSQRKALFEKNNSVPTPIARFGESVTPAMLQKARPHETPNMTPAEAWKRKRAISPSKHQPVEKPEMVKTSQVCTPRIPQPTATPKAVSVTPAPSRPAPTPVAGTPGTPLVGDKTREMHKKLFDNNTTDWRDNSIARKAIEEKQNEMSLLMNRYSHLRKPGAESSSSDQSQQPAHVEPSSSAFPPPPPPPPQEDVYYPGVNSMKRVKVSPPKPGNLYPQVDFDSDTLSSRPESSMSTDTMNSSFESCVTTTASEAPSLGREIVTAARNGVVTVAHDQELSTIPEDNNDSMETDDGDVLTDSVMGAEIDDMLDEAMENEDDAPTPPKIFKFSTSSSGSDQIERSESTTSWEFHTPQPARKHHKDSASKFQTPLITTSSPRTPQQKVEIEGEDGPLLHTVSFYRKQKPATPVQRIVLNPRLESQPEVLESPRATITQKIHQLQEEAGSQMPVIQQASSALNLCRATKEFFGSSEQVEGERLLLVATHKRAAALNEIQRLKTEGGIGADPRQDHSVRGTVSLCGVTLGLKREFVEQLKSGESGDFVHFFLCLVKSAGQVIPTQMVSTAEGLEGTQLHFPNLINFRDLNKDFTIQLEVYGLQTKRESLPHDAKYHIKKGKSTFNLTPKLKISKTESKLSRPNVSSPGGPHTVRTSSFAMVGNALITISSLARKDWRLESVPKISPLDGSVSFKLNCHSESQVKKVTNRGFLTMFDDVSGFGAWHRRWFVLEGNSLSFWKYPENEKVQEPIGRLDLGQSVTRNVSLCPREVCSRMHTFMLETSRAATKEDRDSLVVVRQGSTTVLRHLLSADSRNERVAWCDILNQALDNLRAWDTVRPRTGSASSNDSAHSADTVSSASTEIW